MQSQRCAIAEPGLCLSHHWCTVMRSAIHHNGRTNNFNKPVSAIWARDWNLSAGRTCVAGTCCKVFSLMACYKATSQLPKAVTGLSSWEISLTFRYDPGSTLTVPQQMDMSYQDGASSQDQNGTASHDKATRQEELSWSTKALKRSSCWP